MDPSGPTVFVVDDDAAIRICVLSILQSVNITGKAFSNGREFLEAYDSEYPGCLVLDVRLPEMSGLELQSMLINRRIEIPIIFISGFGDVATAVRAIRAGALDFIEKPFNHQILLERIQQALAIDVENRRRRDQQKAVIRRFELLTDREKQVMALIIAGDANKVMATKLGLSQKTVEFHRAKVMEKMEAASITDLVKLSVLIQWSGEIPGSNGGKSSLLMSAGAPMRWSSMGLNGIT